jgi:hypothetical protein
MSGQAKVHDLDVLRGFRDLWVAFAEVAKEALATMDGDVRRVFANLHEQIARLRLDVKRCEEQVGEAKILLARRKLGRAFGRPVDTTIEEEAVRKAKQRLERMVQWLAHLQRALPQLDRAVQDYTGPKQQLAQWVEIEMARGLASLDRMIAALDEYTRIAAPIEAPPPVLATTPMET